MITVAEPETAQEPEISRDPPERAVRALLPACAGIWTAAEVMHLTAWPGPGGIALGTLGVAGLTYGRYAHKWSHRRNGRAHARHVLTGITLAGGWTAAAAAIGPWGLPYHLLTGTWVSGAIVSWCWLRRHELVVEARDWRQARQEWLTTCREWGLHGSHLISHEETRLGEAWIVSVKGTRRRASQIVRGDLAERIAEYFDLPVSRVRATECRTAGRIRISVRYEDPWAEPIPHPVLDEDPEIDLPVPCSIADLLVVGQDPETGKPLTLPLCGETGGKNVSIVGMLSAGKTVLLNDICERVTAADDAMLFRINLSIKGLAESGMWGPACHLSAFGPSARQRAVRVLTVIAKIIEWRSAQVRVTADFVPSHSSPLLVLVIDEIDAVTEDPALKRILKHLSSKGREFGLTTVTAGQRNTAEWAGGSDIRTQQNVTCLGMVNRRSEAMHAIGDSAMTMTDMSTYGEGHAGVWMIRVAGEGESIGRTFMLKDPADIREIVAERARHQPDLSEEIQKFLGDPYRELLETDEFARWAHGPSLPAAPPPPSFSPAAGVEFGAATVAVVSTTDSLDALDAEMELEMPDGLRREWRARIARAGALNRDTERLLGETGEIPVTDVTPEQSQAHARARWDQLAEETEIPPEVREQLFLLLGGAGSSGRQIAIQLGVGRTQALAWLNRLRFERVVIPPGKGRAAKWKLADPENGDAP